MSYFFCKYVRIHPVTPIEIWEFKNDTDFFKLRAEKF